MDCSNHGCIRPVFRLGLCGHHYEKQRILTAPRCSVDGCELAVHGKGYCTVHYRKFVRKHAPPCSVEGCGRPTVSKCLCDAHRRRKEKYGSMLVKRPADWGSRSNHPLNSMWCNKRRTLGAAGMSEEWYNDFWTFVAEVTPRPTRASRLLRRDKDQPLSKANHEWQEPALSIETQNSKKEYMRKWAIAYRAKNPEKFKSYSFKKRFGVDYATYRLMAQAQGNVCAICAKPESAVNPKSLEPRLLAIDHCHNTGKVRGLLCSKCNTGIGSLNDDVSRLRSAIAYLERHC